MGDLLAFPRPSERSPVVYPSSRPTPEPAPGRHAAPDDERGRRNRQGLADARAALRRGRSKALGVTDPDGAPTREAASGRSGEGDLR